MAKPRGNARTIIEVSVDDAGWAMDAMRERATAYERTAEYLKDGDGDDASFGIEEVSDLAEAQAIAKSYRDVIRRFETAVKSLR